MRERVDIAISVDPEDLCITIQDNGVGFDVDLSRSDQVGLVSMSERASLLHGSLKIDSVISEGTKVTLLLPALFSANEEAAA